MTRTMLTALVIWSISIWHLAWWEPVTFCSYPIFFCSVLLHTEQPGECCDLQRMETDLSKYQAIEC